jgi:microcystin-dependent protein
MTTLQSSFTYNGFSISTPVGTIVSYLGTTDPNGWIICDGIQRTGGNGRYKELKDILNSALGVSSNTQDTVTPPDLRSKLLYGKSLTTGTSGIGGSSSVTILESNMPTHKHNVSASQGAHTHDITDPGHTHTIENPAYELYNSTGVSNQTGGDGQSSGSVPTISTNGTNISIKLASAGSISINESDRGGSTALTLPVPPHFTVNYIIKY